MITLLSYQVATLQALQNSGHAAGNYSAAYGYLRDIAQMQGTDAGVVTWLDRAASINGNDGSWTSEFVRGATQAAGELNGQVITDARFQEVSNLLAQDVISRVINSGGIPDATTIIQMDVARAVLYLGLQPYQWAGTWGDQLPAALGGLGEDYMTLPTSSWRDFAKAWAQTAYSNGVGLGDSVSAMLPSMFQSLLKTILDLLIPPAYGGEDGGVGGGGGGGSQGGGSEGGLSPGDVLGEIPGAVSRAIERMRESFQNAILSYISPFVLDLNGNGIQTLSVSSGAHFDHEGDGFAEMSAWISSEDGFLVWDRNGDGRITSGAELFGDQTVLADGSTGSGFVSLLELDSNGDGRLDANDPAWAELRIWQDTGNDGISNPNEFHGFEEYGIVSIGLSPDDFRADTSYYMDSQGVYHGYSTIFTKTDGSTHLTTDLFFEVNKTYSIATDLVFESAEIRALPNAIGYGNMYDLRQAMARDGSGLLQSLVTNFVAENDPHVRAQILDELLITWAGSNGLDATLIYSAGVDLTVIQLDARRVSVVEQFIGEKMAPIREYGPARISLMWEAYKTLSEYVNAQLMAQTHLKLYFDAVTYSADPVDGHLTGNLAAAGQQLDFLYSLDAVSGESAFLEFVRAIKGFVAESTFVLDTLRVSSATSWLLDSYDARRYIGTSEADVITGTDASDVIRALGGNDTIVDIDGDNAIWGGDGDDSVFVYYGNNLIDGGAGNDWLRVSRDNPEASRYSINTFTGGAGNDRIEGAAGADSYVFNIGDGQDVIEDYDFGYGTTLDKIIFGWGITATGLSISRNADNLIVSIVNSSGLITTDSITMSNWFIGSEYRIERFQFADGTSLGIDDIHALTSYTTNEDDVVTSWDSEWSSPLILNGYAGNDIISGALGDDEITGGTGNDILDGGVGNDVYVFAPGFGNDTINEYDPTVGNSDTIRFTEGLSPADIEIYRDASNLYLSVIGNTDTITVTGFYDDTASRIERVEFSDGTVWTTSTLLAAKMRGTEGSDTMFGDLDDNWLDAAGGDDTLYGEDGNDTLEGGAGNDILYGEAGADILTGGVGNDAMDGGVGNDVYIFEPGFGIDTIYEYDPAAGNTDTIRFTGGLAPTDIEIYRDLSNLYLSVIGTTDKITVVGFYDDTASRIERVEFADGTVWTVSTLLAAKIRGTEGDDNLFGDVGNNWLDGAGGNDYLSGDAGADVVDGGAGNDALYGDDGADTLTGGTGNDTMDGGYGNDVYIFAPGFGNDTIAEYDPTAGNSDTIRFVDGLTPTDIEIYRNSSNLYLSVIGTTDTITVAGFYDDTASRIERVEFGDGTVWTTTTLLTAKIRGTAGDDYLSGDTGNNWLEGVGGNDYLSGDAGADTLDGGAGNDSLDGGAGNDVYLFNRGYGQDIVYETSGTDTVRFGAGIAVGDVIASRDYYNYYFTILDTGDRLTVDSWYAGSTYRIERVEFADGTVWDAATLNSKTTTATQYSDFYWGTTAANTYNGLAGDDHIFGLEGNDNLSGGEGNDFIDGGIGNDTMIGGAGDDTYVVDSASDIVTELAGEGTDTIQSTVTWTLGANIENLTLLDAGGTINGTGNADSNILTGNIYNNVLTGGDGNDTLYGNAGNDTLNGGTGADTMLGGTGNDTYVVDDVGDVVIDLAGQGTDTVQSSISYTLTANVEKLTLTGTAAINATGNELNNTLTGNTGANVLDGGAGNDILNGGKGNDTYVFSPGYGQDTITDNDATAGNQDTALIGVNALELVFTHSGNNLVMSLHGGTDTLTVNSWYTSASYQVEKIQSGDGSTLLNTQVDLLIQAMASFSTQTGLTWDQAIDQRPDEVQAILAGSWQAA